MEKKNTTLLTIIAIAVLFVAVIGATFAYFATSNTNTASLPVDVKTPAGAASFSAVSSGDITINITAQQMDQSLVTESAVAYHDDGTVTVKLKGVDGGGTSNCTYNLVWTWDTGSDQYVPTAGASDATPEFSVAVTSTGGGSLEEKQISVLTSNLSANGTFNLLSGESITAVDNALNDGTVVETTITYTITAKFYNMKIAQPAAVQGKNYKAHVTVSTPSCSQVS